MNQLNKANLLVSVMVVALIFVGVLAAQKSEQVTKPNKAPQSSPATKATEKRVTNNQPLATATLPITPKVKGTKKTHLDAIVTESPTVSPPPPAPPEPTSSPTPEPLFTHIVIGEVMAGSKTNANYEFIELYNPNPGPVDLTGWSVKKKSSSGKESDLIASAHFSKKTISPNKHLLLVSSQYTGLPTPDIIWPASYELAGKKNALILYNKSGEKIDSVEWNEIPVGKSFTRKSQENNIFIVADPSPQNSNQ